MNKQLEQKLMTVMDALEQGESIDDILVRYPNEADTLRPLLETAVALTNLNVQPSLAAQAKSRDSFLAEAAALKARGTAPVPFWLRLRRLLAPALALAVVLILFSAGLVTVSASALPGDPLYGAKLFFEDTRLGLTSDIGEREALAEQFQEERLQEVRALLNSNRAASVTFSGEVDSIDDSAWQIAGITTLVTADTVINGRSQVGAVVMVNGRVQDGTLTALVIDVLENNASPEPESLPTVVPSATPQATLTPTTTPVATAEATATPTATPSPSPTSEPPATLTPTPVPSPTIDGNDNTNNDDTEDDNNGNSNDDDDDDSDENDNSSNDDDDDDDSDENDNSSNDDDDDSDSDENNNDDDMNDNDDDNDDENDNGDDNDNGDNNDDDDDNDNDDDNDGDDDNDND